MALDFRDLSVLGDAIACALMSTQVPEGRQSGQLRALTGAGAFRKMRPLNIGLEQELLQELIRPRGIEIPEEVAFTGLPRSGLGFPAAALVFSASLRNLVQK